jgi:hypothetical protein
VIASLLRAFPEEFLAAEGVPVRALRDLPVPKLVDLVDGHAQFDENQARKQPDWTYR